MGSSLQPSQPLGTYKPSWKTSRSPSEPADLQAQVRGENRGSPAPQRKGWHKLGAAGSSRWAKGGETAKRSEDKGDVAGPTSPGHSAVSLCLVCALAPRRCGWVGCLRLAAAMPAQVVALRHTKARGCQYPPPPHPSGSKGFWEERGFYSVE